MSKQTVWTHKINFQPYSNMLPHGHQFSRRNAAYHADHLRPCFDRHLLDGCIGSARNAALYILGFARGALPEGPPRPVSDSSWRTEVVATWGPCSHRLLCTHTTSQQLDYSKQHRSQASLSPFWLVLLGGFHRYGGLSHALLEDALGALRHECPHRRAKFNSVCTDMVR